MKSFKAFFSFLALATLLFIGASTASAQNGAFAPYVGVGITGTGTGSVLTSDTPSGNVSVGIESSTKHLLLDVNTKLSAPKGYTFDGDQGYTGTVTGSGYLKLGGLLAGGGAYYSNQITVAGINGVSSFLKSVNVTQARPFVGIGYQFSRDRIIANYILPGGFSITNLNPSVADHSFNVTNEIFLGKSGLLKHIRFTQTLAFTSNLTGSTSSILRTTTWVGGGGLKFVL